MLLVSKWNSPLGGVSRSVIWWSWFFVNVGNDNITSSLVLTFDQAGGAEPGAGGQKGKKDRVIISLSLWAREIKKYGQAIVYSLFRKLQVVQ